MIQLHSDVSCPRLCTVGCILDKAIVECTLNKAVVECTLETAIVECTLNKAIVLCTLEKAPRLNCEVHLPPRLSCHPLVHREGLPHHQTMPRVTGVCKENTLTNTFRSSCCILSASCCIIRASAPKVICTLLAVTQRQTLCMCVCKDI